MHIVMHVLAVFGLLFAGMARAAGVPCMPIVLARFVLDVPAAMAEALADLRARVDGAVGGDRCALGHPIGFPASRGFGSKLSQQLLLVRGSGLSAVVQGNSRRRLGGSVRGVEVLSALT